MIQKLIKADKKTFLLAFVIVFIVLSLGLLAATMILQSEANREQRVKADISERSLIETERYFITYKINRLASDLEFVYDTMLQHYVSEDNYEHLEELWLAYSNSRKVYDQIRFLDASGNEVIRVDYTPEGAFIMPKDQLQNKKSRYYFKHTIELSQNQLYISTLDLNMERGAIELPINPVIRFAQPYFDANGLKQGIIILNYSANDMLSQIASVATGSEGEVYLLNSDSFWLYHSRASYNEWTFSFNPDSTVKFSNYYPKEWAMISAGGTGTMTTDSGYFTYATIPYNTISQLDSKSMQLTSEPDYWYVVGFIPNTLENNKYPSSNIFDLAISALMQYFPLYFLVLFISLVLAGFITINRTKSKEIKYFSQYDRMTNSYNRNAGIDKLSDLYRSLSKSNCAASLCFIDVNGLKEVNDTLGHETGDELLITVSKIIRSCIRANDFLVRLGGDEFLIVFQGIEAEVAEDVWARIVEEFNKINNYENRRYLISVSHGIETLSCNVNELLDNVLHQADAKMYDEKRRIKANLQIIRS